MIKGIDVSSYQSDTPPLGGMDFVFVKATEGTGYVNPRMRAQAAHARASGRITGFYHYLKPGSMRAQAAYFVQQAASLEGDPLWADWEDPGVSCADKDEFLREVLRLRGGTHRVGLYCNTNYWTTRDTTSYCADALWIAVYNGRPGHPGIEHRWLFHQYTSTPIDTSLGAFASRAALNAWCTKSPGEAPAAEHDSKENDMALDLRTKVPVADWVANGWPHPAGDDPHSILLQTALGSGYGHARRAADASEAALAQLGAMRGTIDKLVDALGDAGGITAEQVQAAAQAGARAALAELGKTLTDKEA